MAVFDPCMHMWFSFCSSVHFDIGVRVAVSIHGSQVNTAHDSHNETVGLGAVHEGHQDPTALLHLSAILPWLRRKEDGKVAQHHPLVFTCFNS